jgi:hypothetical protein
MLVPNRPGRREEPDMSLTIEITDIPADLIADVATHGPVAVPAPPSADGWLSAMWGIRPGTSVPATAAGVTSRYPVEIAEWLHRMWGIPLRTA